MSRGIAHGVIAALVALSAAPAAAENFAELGSDLTPDQDAAVEVSGALRWRAESLINLDLDRGLTPSGRPFYPVPIAPAPGADIPSEQALLYSDLRLRTDVALYAPFGSSRVNIRVDVLDNIPMGGDPNLTPLTTTTQLAPTQRAFRIKRAYGEALTPFGVVAAGRMGNTWGLGILSNGGDCPDCDSGDAADRFAFITSQFDHFFAFAYDIAWVGATTERRVDTRLIDLEPSDDVTNLTFAVLKYRDETALIRRRKAGKLTFDYGASFSQRWQQNDIPATYLPTTEDPVIDSNQVVRRDLSAQAVDTWFRLIGPGLKIEAEAAVLLANIGQGSLIPGVRFDQPLTSLQWGAAIVSEFGAPESAFSAGLDLGVASGDAAYGFGAYPGPNDPQPQPGDLEGPQANPPFDNTVDNFRFNPDYRIDRILFREIIGTVTDAAYIRPHLRWDMWKAAPGKLTFQMAGVASFALYASSTPGAETPLGVELDPSIVYESRDKFGLQLDYAVLFPLAGLDNIATGMRAQPAQLLRLRLTYGF